MKAPMIRFIITHGNLAQELNRVSQKFLQDEIPTYTYSNDVDSIERIEKDVLQKIEETADKKAVIFVDLLGGSCWHAAMRIKKKMCDTAIITGVNIPALVSFSTNAPRMEWAELLEKIEEDAHKAIRMVK